MQGVNEPPGMEDIEHIKDTVDVDSGRKRCLGNARSSLAPGIITYRGTRWESRGGREGTHLQYTRDDGGKRSS